MRQRNKWRLHAASDRKEASSDRTNRDSFFFKNPTEVASPATLAVVNRGESEANGRATFFFFLLVSLSDKPAFTDNLSSPEGGR